MDTQGSMSSMLMKGLGCFTHNESVSKIHDMVVQMPSSPFNTKEND